MPCRATQEGQVMVESSDKVGSLEKIMENHFSILAWEPQKQYEKARIWHWKMNSPGPYMPNMLLDKSKEITPLGPWIKVKQDITRVNIYILGISELKWTGMGEFNSNDHYTYYCWQESLRRNGVALIVSKRVWNEVLGRNLKNDRMISVLFQGKPFSITVIQVYAPTSSVEEAEVEQFYEDLEDLLELTPIKDVLFIIRDWNAKVGSQEIPEVTGKLGLRAQNEAGQRLTEFYQ